MPELADDSPELCRCFFSCFLVSWMFSAGDLARQATILAGDSCFFGVTLSPFDLFSWLLIGVDVFFATGAFGTTAVGRLCPAERIDWTTFCVAFVCKIIVNHLLI